MEDLSPPSVPINPKFPPPYTFFDILELSATTIVEAYIFPTESEETFPDEGLIPQPAPNIFPPSAPLVP
ncbi:MAG: hypothetical protein IJ557_08315 [Bacteroidaceae bacterium]|nr:hypothetical protein [Bacteroidaceae bacterium]